MQETKPSTSIVNTQFSLGMTETKQKKPKTKTKKVTVNSPLGNVTHKISVLKKIPKTKQIGSGETQEGSPGSHRPSCPMATSAKF
jgi:hypothetical protein